MIEIFKEVKNQNYDNKLLSDKPAGDTTTALYNYYSKARLEAHTLNERSSSMQA
jgi:hypothetical protein